MTYIRTFWGCGCNLLVGLCFNFLFWICSSAAGNSLFVLNDSRSVGYLAFVELHFLERRGFFILRPSHGSDREILYGCFLSGSSHSDVGVGLFSQIGLHLFFVAETGRLLRLFEALVFAELLEGDRRSPGWLGLIPRGPLLREPGLLTTQFCWLLLQSTISVNK